MSPRAGEVVEHERCDACGFDGADYDDDSLLDALRGLGEQWRALIDSTGSELRRRPATQVWSAIEYAAHSRDITALHAFGVEQAVSMDEPSYPAIDGDDLIDAARLMGEKRIRHLPVAQGEFLVGMPGIRDVLGRLVEQVAQQDDDARETARSLLQRVPRA